MDNAASNISLIGKSGNEYYGTIYNHKTETTDLEGTVIVCLANTVWKDNYWQHNIRDIYNDDALHALEHFKERDDISHLILIAEDKTLEPQPNIIDDLRRKYLHCQDN